jgi:Tol biopolymer transport system component
VPGDWTPWNPVVSRDGRTVVYVARRQAPGGDDNDPRLFVRTLADPEPRPVRGSENADGYTFSPDGRWLAFHAPASANSTDRTLFKVPVDGSAPPLELAAMPNTLFWNWTAVWTPADEIVLSIESPPSVVVIPAEGGSFGAPVEIEGVDFEEGGGDFSLEDPLPDGRHILAVSWLYEAEGWMRRIVLLDLETGQARLLLEDADNPRWLPTGHLLFSRNDSLLAVPFDRNRLEVAGGPVAVRGGLRTANTWAGADFDVSENGTLVHLTGGVVGANRRLKLSAPDGSVVPWSDEPRAYQGEISVSPDGRWMAATIVNPRALYEIWGSEIDRPLFKRLAAEPGMDCSKPVWSYDGSLLAYTVFGESGQAGIYVREVDGEGEPRVLVERDRRDEVGWPSSFSPDGSWLLGQRISTDRADLMLSRIDDDDREEQEPRLLIENARDGSISPDGRWVCYVSDSSGRSELYIRSFRADGSVGREIPVTTTGAVGVGWFKQERPLKLYYGKDRMIYAVELRTRPTVSFSEPEHLAWATALFPKVTDVDTLPDGRVLGIFKGEDEESPHEIRVVLNWFEELEDKLAARR